MRCVLIHLHVLNKDKPRKDVHHPEEAQYLPIRQKELKASYMHWDMVPFGRLDAFTQELDRVCIAAMAACGFVDAKRGQD